MRRGLLLAVWLAARPASAKLVTDWSDTDTLRHGAGYAITLSTPGNVFVAGTRSVTGTGLVPQVWKYSALGTLYFTVTLFGVPGAALGVAPWPTGGAVVGGRMYSGTATGDDAWLVRLAVTGGTLWASTFNGPASGNDAIAGVAMTPSGNIAVTGFKTTSLGGADAWVALISPAGVQLGEDLLVDVFGQEETGRAITADAAGNLYAVGTVWTPGQGKDVWVAKYLPTTPALTQAWSIVLNGPASSTDFGTGVALDPQGNVVVTGAATGPEGTRDILVAKIANGSTALADGTVIWARTIDGGEQDQDEAEAVSVSAAGDIYVTGSVDRLGPGFTNFWLARFTAGGSLVWEMDLDGSANDDDAGRGIIVDPNGILYVTGDETNLGAGRTMFTERIQDYPATTPAAGTGAAGPRALPNPFRPGHGGPQDAAGITFAPLSARSTVRVYTLAGALVAELADADGDGIIVWNAKTPDGTAVVSGVYLFVVAPPTGTVSRGKVVIIR